MCKFKLLNNERQKLQSHADGLARELTFTKRELERYQRDHTVLNVQVKMWKLIFKQF